MKLKPDGIGVERAGRQPQPRDRALARPQPRLASAARIAEGDHPIGRTRQVGDDEADAQNGFAGMPHDLANYPARPRPASGLIAEIGMEPPHMVRGTSDRACQQTADLFLKDLSSGTRMSCMTPSAPWYS